MKIFKRGFTLAEILVVLVILGVVATLTIPSALHRTSERANKTRIRKAMTVYETAVEKMIIENNIPRNEASLTAFVLGQNNDCAPARGYFKMNSLETPGNNCRFRASDGLWWDITDIANTMVAFNNVDLNYRTSVGGEYKSFRFVTRFDDNAITKLNDTSYTGYNSTGSSTYRTYSGEIIVKDLFTTDILYKESVKKVWAYLDNTVYEEDLYLTNSEICQNGNNKSCTKPENWGSRGYYGGDVCTSYDKNGKWVVARWKCESGCDNCKYWYINERFEKAGSKYEYRPWACNEDKSVCANTDFDKLDNNGNQLFHAWYCNGATDNGSGAVAKRCMGKYSCVSCNGCESQGYERSEDGCYHLDP